MVGSYISILAFSIVVATGIVWFRRAFAVALPANRSRFVASMVLGLCLGIAALILGAGVTGGVLSTLAILLAGIFIFTFLISAQKGGSEHLQPGSALLSFNSIDHLGDIFSSDSLDGKAVLLKFFRGHW